MKRNQDMRQRFIDKYGIDFINENNYDLVIDTDINTPESIADIIISHLNEIEKTTIHLENDDDKLAIYAEITVNKKTKELIGYKIFANSDEQQAHAIKINNGKFEYWHLEIVSPCPYPVEPILENFVEHYYTNILNNIDMAKKECSLPIVSYELLKGRELLVIRYAMLVNELRKKPLFRLYFRNGYSDGY